MIKQQAAWSLISNSLRQGIPVMLLYVLQSKGSSPGRRGFMMAVNRDGDMEGSIGGGIMEHKFVEMAREQLHKNGQLLAVRQQIHDKKTAKNQSGMICSGEQTIFLYQVQAADQLQVDGLLSSLQQNGNGLLQLSPKGLAFEADGVGDDLFLMTNQQEWLYRERTGYIHYVYIIGGGHCALALSRMMSMLGFYVHVYDDRPELNTLLQNTDANQKTLVNNYAELQQLIPGGKHHYVVAMTAGYRTDDIAIKALLNKDFSYFGVLGSKKKIKKMLAEYAEAGMQHRWLNRIHSPVGIQIKSQTPEEIAVSIAAQIIKIKNAGL